MWYIPIGFVLLVASIVYVFFRFKVDEGEIIVGRKPKVKLNEVCKKYYVECERILKPIIGPEHSSYGFVLSSVERNLSQSYSLYKKGDKAFYDYYVDLFEDITNEKCHGWALGMCTLALYNQIYRTFSVRNEEEIEFYNYLKKEFFKWADTDTCPQSFKDAFEGI